MADTPRPRPGSLASLLHGLGALLSSRAELARLEWQEQQERLLLQTMLAGLAVVLLLAALVALLLFVALVTPVAWRATVMGGFALLLAGSGIGLLLALRRRAERAPAAFACTLQELRKDWQALSGKEQP